MVPRWSGNGSPVCKSISYRCMYQTFWNYTTSMDTSNIILSYLVIFGDPLSCKKLHLIISKDQLGPRLHCPPYGQNHSIQVRPNHHLASLLQDMGGTWGNHVDDVDVGQTQCKGIISSFFFPGHDWHVALLLHVRPLTSSVHDNTVSHQTT